jgi:hypothetical protein
VPTTYWPYLSFGMSALRRTTTLSTLKIGSATGRLGVSSAICRSHSDSASTP